MDNSQLNAERAARFQSQPHASVTTENLKANAVDPNTVDTTNNAAVNAAEITAVEAEKIRLNAEGNFLTYEEDAVKAEQAAAKAEGDRLQAERTGNPVPPAVSRPAPTTPEAQAAASVAQARVNANNIVAASVKANAPATSPAPVAASAVVPTVHPATPAVVVAPVVVPASAVKPTH
jgi:hypothetical protein